MILCPEYMKENNNNNNAQKQSVVLTHICFVFKRVLAIIPSAMKMSSPLSIKSAIRSLTLFCRSIPLKTFLNYGRILSVVVGVHLNIRCTYVGFVATFLRIQASVLELFFNSITILHVIKLDVLTCTQW